MINMEKMNKIDFDSYLESSIIEYAKEKVKAGTWAENESLEKSRHTFNTLLSKGVDTENQFLYALIDSDTDAKVGYLWFQLFEKLTGREAFIYDFKIFENYRGKGYGTQTMAALETEVRKHNIDKISLHVFAHNKIAIKLYEKMGYEVTDIEMSKKVI